MQEPKKRKYRKAHRGRNRGVAASGTAVSFGEFGLRATGRGRLTARQIEAARRVITRSLKRVGRVWIRVFADKPISKKPPEVRMGSGKGNVEFWAAEIRPGKMIYEVEGVSEAAAREAFRLAGAKLPLATAFARRGAAGVSR
ncbi:MAG: 50S ribosomal protein L16 [Betaproteobacteria bacterium]|nr:50S ribosomal protein L16 [Betaproteobacteria bacterium]